MTRCIGVFCTESWSESINPSQSHCRSFTFQLSGNRQVGFLSKEILSKIDFSVFCFWNIIKVKIRNTKHFSGSFCISSRNYRRVDVEKLILIEERVDCKTHSVTHSENCAKQIGSESQMRLLTQFLQTMFLRLKNSCLQFVKEIISKNSDFLCDDFYSLTCTLAFYHLTYNFQRRSSIDFLDSFLIEIFKIYYNLQIINRRTVIQCDKAIRTKRTNPTLNGDVVM